MVRNPKALVARKTRTDILKYDWDRALAAFAQSDKERSIRTQHSKEQGADGDEERAGGASIRGDVSEVSAHPDSSREEER
jgi:hypothetical protein